MQGKALNLSFAGLRATRKFARINFCPYPQKALICKKCLNLRLFVAQGCGVSERDGYGVRDVKGLNVFLYAK